MKKLLTYLVAIASMLTLTACAGMQITTSKSPALDRIVMNNELVVGTAAAMPPLNMTTRDGEIIGMEIDLARAMADSMGVKLRLEAMQFNELLPALEAGKIDMILSGMTITPERNMKVAFVGPYFRSGKAILTKLPTMAQAQTPEDIHDPRKSIVTLRGSTSEEFVKKNLPKVKLVTANSYDEAVGMVINGKVDAMFADYTICVVTIFRYPKEELLTVISPLTYEPLGIALPDNDPLFVNWVGNYLTTLEDSGALEELTWEWFENADWLKRLP
jgi:polar amino acid transport system substrate-binding protein